MNKKIKRILAWLPSPLPFGVTEFETWAADIVHTYDLPDNESSRWTLATMIQHCGATEYYKPKRYFGLCARKGGANQVAGHIMWELKQKQKAEQEAAKAAEEAAKLAEQTSDTQSTPEAI